MRLNRYAIQTFLSLMILSMAAAGQGRPAAHMIVTNAKIWTGDSGRPQAEALAVWRDRIVAVGTNSEVNAWRGPQTAVYDARGALITPGFNDAHVHFIDGGNHLKEVQLKDAKTPQEFARRIAERAALTPKGEWVTGGDWDEQQWTPAALPTKELIDSLTPDMPVWVNRYDGHESLANSVLLKMAGITAKTPDPAGGEIVHDAEGNPTGVLRDAAMGLVDKITPPMTHEHRMRALGQALGHAASLGVTSVQDMNPEYEDIAVYEPVDADIRPVAGAGIGAISVISRSAANASLVKLVDSVQTLNPGIRIKQEESAPTKPTLFLCVVADEDSSAIAREIAGRYRRIPAIAVRLDLRQSVTILPGSSPCPICCEPDPLAPPKTPQGNPERAILAATAEALKLLAGIGEQRPVIFEFRGLETTQLEPTVRSGCTICS